MVYPFTAEVIYYEGVVVRLTGIAYCTYTLHTICERWGGTVIYHLVKLVVIRLVCLWLSLLIMFV